MHGRIAPLTRLAALALLLAAPGQARAHRLEAEYRVLPGNKVQVESWFDLTGDSPRGAQVKVYRADGQLLTDGKLDEQAARKNFEAMNALHKDMFESWLQAQKQMDSILTREQREQLQRGPRGR